jgi:hypothetical protein
MIVLGGGSKLAALAERATLAPVAADPSLASPFGLLPGLVEAPNAIGVLVNPATCSVDADWSNALNELRDRNRLRGVALVFGIAEQHAAEAAVRAIGLDFEVRLLTDQEAASIRVGVPAPLLFVVRSHEVVLLAAGSRLRSAPEWLGRALGTEQHRGAPR